MKLKRFLSLLLLVAVVASCLAQTVFAIDRIDREDTENIAYKDTVLPEDLWLHTYNGNNAVSSSGNNIGDNRWTKFSGKDSLGVMTDPADSSNKVGYLKGKGSPWVRRDGLLGKAGRHLVLTNRFYLPLVTDASGNEYYLPTFTLKLSNQTMVSFVYNAQTGLYDFTTFGQSGTVAPESWFGVSMMVSPSETAGFSESTLVLQVSGDTVKNSAGEATAYVKSTKASFSYNNSAKDTASFRMDWTTPKDADGNNIASGPYIDDSHGYLTGTFLMPNVKEPTYDDTALNVNLNGKFTVEFTHPLDLSTFDLSKVKLFVFDEGDTEYTELYMDSSNPTSITFSFAEDTLTTYTTYYVVFDEGVRSITGESLYESTTVFITKGVKDSCPAPEPIITPPSGGYVMPDEYNTGYRCDESELVPFAEKYPLAAGKNITEEIAAAYNYEFCGFTLTGNINVTASSPVYIHDFYLYATGHYGIQNNGSQRLTVAWAECTAGGSAMFIGSNLTLSHVYCYDVPADHMKGNSNQIIESCYFRDGGTRNYGAHADVLQISCSTTRVTNSIKVLGCRFDIPPMGYEHVANACIFIKPEKSQSTGAISKGYANLQISYNWFNGGGYTSYLLDNDVPVEDINYFTYSHNTIGNGYNFAPVIFTNVVKASQGCLYTDNEMASMLEAGSVVFYDQDGNRIFNVNELSGEGEVLVNLANYAPDARTYTVLVEVLGASGEVVKTYTASDEVIRYMNPDEYWVPANYESIEIQVEENGQTVTKTVHVPKEGAINLPANVPATVALTDLPDMNGCTLQVSIYDTTAEETLIRSSLLSNKVYENTLMPGYVHEDHVYDGDCDEDCNECGEVRAAGAHTFTDKYVYNNDATHMADGTKTVICDVCGKKGNATVVAEGTKLVDAHTFAGEWESDAENHWKACVCGEKGSVAAHMDADDNGHCDICDYVPSGYEEKIAFENAASALTSFENATLSAKYEALYSVALAFAAVEDKQTVMQGQAYQTYVAFAESYNEAAFAIANDIVKY